MTVRTIMRTQRWFAASVAFAASLLALSGCAEGEVKAGLGPNEDAVTAVVVSVAQSSISVGQAVLVHAEGRTASGQPAPVEVTWSVSGGSVVALSDSVGSFSAGAAGAYVVRATAAASPAVTDSTTISVVMPTSPTVSVALAPGSASLATGGVQAFSVVATRQDGSTYQPSVSWSATGGTVTSGGLYTAGTAAGSFRVIATQLGGTLADTAPITVTAPVLQAVILTPSSASLVGGGTRQFSVSGQWSNGATTAPAVNYTATGGTINSGGLYTAGTTAGAYRVIATQQGGSLADTSSVTISVATQLTVTTQPVGASDAQGFGTPPAIQLRNAGGSAVAQSGVTITATLASGSGSLLGGTTAVTNASGLATFSGLAVDASAPPASFTLTFSAPGLTSATSAPFTVAVLVGHGNQPAGFTPIFERLFTTLPGTPGGDLVGRSSIDYGSNYLAIITDATGPKSNSSLQITWPSGLAGGDSPSHWDFWSSAGANSYTPKYNEVYIEAYLKCPAADFLNNQVGTKLWYMSYGGDGSYNLNDSFMLLGRYATPSAPMSSMTMDMHTAEVDDRETSDPTQGAAQEREQNLGGGKEFTCGGHWNHIETYMNLGTPNNHNGVLRVWIDGIQVTEYTNLKYLDTDYNYTHGFYHGEWTPVWGGSGPARTRSDVMYLNYFYVSGR